MNGVEINTGKARRARYGCWSNAVETGYMSFFGLTCKVMRRWTCCVYATCVDRKQRDVRCVSAVSPFWSNKSDGPPTHCYCALNSIGCTSPLPPCPVYIHPSCAQQYIHSMCIWLSREGLCSPGDGAYQKKETVTPPEARATQIRGESSTRH